MMMTMTMTTTTQQRWWQRRWERQQQQRHNNDDDDDDNNNDTTTMMTTTTTTITTQQQRWRRRRQQRWRWVWQERWWKQRKGRKKVFCISLKCSAFCRALVLHLIVYVSATAKKLISENSFVGEIKSLQRYRPPGSKEKLSAQRKSCISIGYIYFSAVQKGPILRNGGWY